ncbi:MAG: 30S ribosomal protein S20 [Bdellovibrio sp.]|nr:MAG: 30S ribosomal protein S20 [Bdellovibrio sp.]
MANHKSAEKRARQSLRRSARNSQLKKKVGTLERKVVVALQAKSQDLQKVLAEYVSRIMKAVSKGVIKKETASRKISRLSKRAAAKASVG